jgi:hypothetical protein
MTGGWRNLHNEKLHNLLPLPSIIRMMPKSMRWEGYLARMGEKRHAYWILVRKPEEKRPLGRPTLMWQDNIKMDLRGLGWNGVDWIDMAQDRDQWRALLNVVLNLRVS